MGEKGFRERYHMVKKLGEGGFGQVFEVFDTHRGSRAAMKLIDLERPGGEDNYERERKMLASQTERFFPVLFDSCRDGSCGILVMEYLEGITLRELVEKQGPLPVNQACFFVEEACRMLEYLHGFSPRILYLDLKPDNLILEPSGRLRLLDFGTVRRVSNDAAELSGLPMGLYGTPGFSAPEVWKPAHGCAPDTCSDTYSLGALLFYLLTGFSPDRPPYVLPELRRLDPSLPEALSLILQRATHEDPAKRYHEVKEFLKAIKEDRKKKIFFFRKSSVRPIRILENIWQTKKPYPGLFALVVLGTALSLNLKAEGVEKEVEREVVKVMLPAAGTEQPSEPVPEETQASEALLSSDLTLLDTEGRKLLTMEGSDFDPGGDIHLLLPEELFVADQDYKLRISITDGQGSREKEYSIRYKK